MKAAESVPERVHSAAPPPAQGQRVIERLLEEVDRAGIPYVSWKNNQALAAYLAGNGDLDLLVAPDHRARFMALAFQAGWVELESPGARFPAVCHLFRAVGSGRVYHLHVYFRVVTGESWLKEYVLPLENFLLENRVRASGSGIFVLNAPTQRYLFALRHLLKGGSLSSRWLYRRELGSYQQEWVACGGPAGWDPELGPVSLSDYVKGARLEGADVKLPSTGAAIRLRRSVAPFLRVGRWTLPARRFGCFLQRALNKLFWKRKKVLPRGGLVIAISGVDGSGKSTVLHAMSAFFSRFITVDQYRLGRPQGHLLEAMRRVAVRCRRGRQPGIRTPLSSPAQRVPRAVAAAVLAWVRLQTARRAARAARRGHLVLTDRWPAAELGKMDGPRIVPGGPQRNGLVERLGRFEQWAYSRTPRADLCLVLTVSVESALARNRDRVKGEKESDDEIRRRFEENQTIEPLANKVIRFDNDGVFELMRGRLTETIWAEVANH